LITLALTAFDLLLLLTDFRIRPNGYLIALTAAAIYGVCGHLNANSVRSRPWIFSMLTGIAQMIMVVAVMTSMTYIAAAATFPLQDSRLLAFDRALGFDFRAFVAYLNARDWLSGYWRRAIGRSPGQSCSMWSCCRSPAAICRPGSSCSRS
jgi:hypothetical protein